ncbi:hypothetical protein [Streptomyces sp. NBC_01803]|uniref:hypothetical protein n=1 Tax=Streptomyces sp. NBC_01803 TaxID=2975946 RepID=UPI002DDB88BD|nr:hypothetical protein [Streptomyces sp. NBC_01803]WSA45617.1 hypothetical protein OIE51_16255 [Streptomyces sp. NBC_01803]
MADWVAGFDYPDEGWIQLDMGETDVAEQAAQLVADRGGEHDQAYAEAVYEELKVIRDGALERDASPVVVYVPEAPPQSLPMVPVSAFVAPWELPEERRTLETLTGLARQPRPYRFREPDVRTVDLPAGPACRVHELVVNEAGDDDRQTLMEYVSYYVIPPGYPDGVIEMTVTWASPAVGDVMVETADEMAATLTVNRTEDAA